MSRIKTEYLKFSQRVTDALASKSNALFEGSRVISLDAGFDDATSTLLVSLNGVQYRMDASDLTRARLAADGHLGPELVHIGQRILRDIHSRRSRKAKYRRVMALWGDEGVVPWEEHLPDADTPGMRSLVIALTAPDRLPATADEARMQGLRVPPVSAECWNCLCRVVSRLKSHRW